MRILSLVFAVASFAVSASMIVFLLDPSTALLPTIGYFTEHVTRLVSPATLLTASVLAAYASATFIVHRLNARSFWTRLTARSSLMAPSPT